MKLRKAALWIAVLATISLIASLDLNALFDWGGNRILLSPPSEPAFVEVGSPWKVAARANLRDPFGNHETFVIPPDQYRLTIHPLDDHTERCAVIADDSVSSAEPAILHLEFRIELRPESEYRFASSEPASGRWRQLLLVGIDPRSDWRAIDLDAEPEIVRRHMSVISRTEYDGQGSTYFPWMPERVVSTGDATLMCDATVVTRAGHTYLRHSYAMFDGTDDRELPPPPVLRGSPAICVFDGQWILAGGAIPHEGYTVEQIVAAFDLETEEWSMLPPLPDEASYPAAAFEHRGHLAVYSPVHDHATDTWGPNTLYVLRDGQWSAESALAFDLPTGDTFGLETGLLCVETQETHNAIKLLRDGYLQTIGVAEGYSGNAPVTVVDNRALQWRDEGVYELELRLLEELQSAAGEERDEVAE